MIYANNAPPSARTRRNSARVLPSDAVVDTSPVEDDVPPLMEPDESGDEGDEDDDAPFVVHHRLKRLSKAAGKGGAGGADKEKPPDPDSSGDEDPPPLREPDGSDDEGPPLADGALSGAPPDPSNGGEKRADKRAVGRPRKSKPPERSPFDPELPGMDFSLTVLSNGQHCPPLWHKIVYEFCVAHGSRCGVGLERGGKAEHLHVQSVATFPSLTDDATIELIKKMLKVALGVRRGDGLKWCACFA